MPQPTQLNAVEGTDDAALIHVCDFWNARGNAAFIQQEWEQALEAYGHATALSYQYHHYIHFDCSALHTERAYLHLAADNMEQAKSDIREAVFQDHNNPLKDWKPGNPIPGYTAADPLKDNWQRHIALPYTEGNLNRRHFHPDIACYRALHQTARRTRILDAYDTAIATATAFHHHYHRHAARHHLNRGLTYFRLQCYDIALNDFSKACDLDKHWADAWRCRGDARIVLGNLRAARADYVRAEACE